MTSPGRVRLAVVPARSPGHIVIRDARPSDRHTITTIVAADFAASATGRWLDPNRATRKTLARIHADTVVEDAFTHGTVRVADQDGTPIAGALAVPHPRPEELNPRVPERSGPGHLDEDSPNAQVLHRLERLEQLLRHRHPSTAHQHLTALSVQADHRGNGLAIYLLTDHHHEYAQRGLPTCLEVDDPRLRQLCRRHGYLDIDIGEPIILPAGVTRIWPMWRPSGPVDNCPS